MNEEQALLLQDMFLMLPPLCLDLLLALTSITRHCPSVVKLLLMLFILENDCWSRTKMYVPMRN